MKVGLTHGSEFSPGMSAPRFLACATGGSDEYSASIQSQKHNHGKIWSGLFKAKKMNLKAKPIASAIVGSLFRQRDRIMVELQEGVLKSKL
jgi:hypothetical protein